MVTCERHMLYPFIYQVKRKLAHLYIVSPIKRNQNGSETILFLN